MGYLAPAIAATYTNGMIISSALGNVANVVPNAVIQGFPTTAAAGSAAAGSIISSVESIDPSSVTSEANQIVSSLLPTSSGGSSILSTAPNSLSTDQLVVSNVLGSASSSTNDLLANTYGNFNEAAQVVSTLA